MSAAEQYGTEFDEQPEETYTPTVLSVAADTVEVRRNAGLAAVIGGVASVVAIAWFARAIATGSFVDWALAVVMGGLGALWLAGFVDARTPLLVADAQGVRLRLGRAWIGLPWTAVARVEHTPRRGLLRDGRLEVVPHNPERVLSELSVPASRQARVSTRLHGGPLALPLGLSTSVTGAGDDLGAALTRLADAGSEVVLLEPFGEVGDEVLVHDVPTAADADSDVAGADPALERLRARTLQVGPAVARLLEDVAGRLPRRTREDGTESDEAVTDQVVVSVTGEAAQPVDVEADVVEVVDAVEVVEVEVTPSPAPAPVREVAAPARSEVLREVVSRPTVEAGAEVDAEAVDADVEQPEEPRRSWGDRVRPIARERHAVAPVVFDDVALEPAADPVIGPELRAARTRIGLTTDQLAERTRIRPHVIEAIEVDDFVPCGGDFYARGHLRTLARVLGVDVQPLLESYEQRYAHAPVDARRVFEAELATGSHGSIRGTRGGPNWSILVAAVMAVVLAWSVARLVMDVPNEVRSTPVLNGSGGPGGNDGAAVAPVKVVVQAPTSGAEVVVRDSAGSVVLQSSLAIGEKQQVSAIPPLRVQTTDGSVTVTVAGKKRGPVGEAGEPAQGTYAGD